MFKYVKGGKDVGQVVAVRRLLSATGKSAHPTAVWFALLLADSGESGCGIAGGKEIEGIKEFGEVFAVSAGLGSGLQISQLASCVGGG